MSMNMDEAAVEAIVERNIRRAMVDSGIGEVELASRIGLGDKGFASRPDGLSPDELVRMMEVLNITPEQVFQGVA
jgi:hypothetical protein